MPASVLGASAYWLAKGALYRPAMGIEPHFEGCAFESNSPSPFRERVAFVSKHQKPVVSLIAGLNWWQSPRYVAGLVVTVVVRAFERVPCGWPWSKVGQESNKAVSPAFANLNSTATVALPSYGPWIGAAFDHSSPGVVLRSASFPACPAMAVSGAFEGRKLSAETSA